MLLQDSSCTDATEVGGDSEGCHRTYQVMPNVTRRTTAAADRKIEVVLARRRDTSGSFRSITNERNILAFSSIDVRPHVGVAHMLVLHAPKLPMFDSLFGISSFALSVRCTHRSRLDRTMPRSAISTHRAAKGNDHSCRDITTSAPLIRNVKSR